MSEKSVLVVEDDALVQGAMRMVLEWEGFEVTCASNGQEALEALRQSTPPSLILLDLMMPVLDGWQFRREQQSDPALAPIPVVVVSAASGAPAVDAAAHVQKPFSPTELLAAIHRAQHSPK